MGSRPGEGLRRVSTGHALGSQVSLFLPLLHSDVRAFSPLPASISLCEEGLQLAAPGSPWGTAPTTHQGWWEDLHPKQAQDKGDLVFRRPLATEPEGHLSCFPNLPGEYGATWGTQSVCSPRQSVTNTELRE